MSKGEASKAEASNALVGAAGGASVGISVGTAARQAVLSRRARRQPRNNGDYACTSNHEGDDLLRPIDRLGLHQQ